MENQFDDIRVKVDAFLNEKNVQFDCTYVGKTVRRAQSKDEEDWPCDQWSVSFRKDVSFGYPNGETSFETDYFTGLGLRKIPKRNADPENAHPVKPDAADVLHSLVLDASVVNQSFNEWCSEYGYDSDSIRALNTYQSCCGIAEKLRAVFSGEDMETLRELLQDY